MFACELHGQCVSRLSELLHFVRTEAFQCLNPPLVYQHVKVRLIPMAQCSFSVRLRCFFAQPMSFDPPSAFEAQDRPIGHAKH